MYIRFDNITKERLLLIGYGIFYKKIKTFLLCFHKLIKTLVLVWEKSTTLNCKGGKVQKPGKLYPMDNLATKTLYFWSKLFIYF